MKSNFRIIILNLSIASILVGITSCKKEVGSSDKSNVLKPKQRISATYNSQYFNAVNKAIRQGKDYSYFRQQIPGWRIIDNASNLTNGLHRTQEESDPFDPNAVDDNEQEAGYRSGFLEDDGAYVFEWTYGNNMYPQAEDILYNNGNFSYYTTITGEPMEYYQGTSYWEPKPHLMLVGDVGHFTKRNVNMSVNLPLMYTRWVKDQGGLRGFAYANVPNDRGNFSLSGQKMGELDETGKTFNFSLDRNGNGYFYGYGVQEKRTVIWTTGGSAVISTNVNVGVFQAGGTISGNLTISRAENTFTQYNVSGTITLDTESYYNTPGFQLNSQGISVGWQVE